MHPQLRILHFVSTPDRGSGVMSVIMNYYRHIDRSRFAFDLLCFVHPSPEDSYEPELRALGGRVYYVPKPGSSASVQALLRFFRKHRNEYACFHNHEVYLTWLLAPLARRFGIPGFIVHCHATQYSDRKLAAWRNRLLCLPIRSMRHIRRAACSRAAARFLYGSRLLEAGKVSILPNAIAPAHCAFSEQKRADCRKALGVEDETVLLGTIGRMTPQKNQRFLLELLERLEQAAPQRCKLLLLGDGPLRGELEGFIRRHGLSDAVLLPGQVADTSAYLSAMDLFLLPSLYEGLPMALMEAQANGLSCLVSDQITEEALMSDKAVRLPLSLNYWCRVIKHSFHPRSDCISIYHGDFIHDIENNAQAATATKEGDAIPSNSRADHGNPASNQSRGTGNAIPTKLLSSEFNIQNAVGCLTRLYEETAASACSKTPKKKA